MTNTLTVQDLTNKINKELASTLAQVHASLSGKESTPEINQLVADLKAHGIDKYHIYSGTLLKYVLRSLTDLEREAFNLVGEMAYTHLVPALHEEKNCKKFSTSMKNLKEVALVLGTRGRTAYTYVESDFVLGCNLEEMPRIAKQLELTAEAHYLALVEEEAEKALAKVKKMKEAVQDKINLHGEIPSEDVRYSKDIKVDLYNFIEFS